MIKDPANFPGKLNKIKKKSRPFSHFHLIEYQQQISQTKKNLYKPESYVRYNQKPVNFLTKQSKPVKIQSRETKTRL